MNPGSYTTSRGSHPCLMLNENRQRTFVFVIMMVWGAIGHMSLSPLQENARLHVTGIMWTFLDTENDRLFRFPARSLDLSPIENARSMVAERLVRHHAAVTTVDELWLRVEEAAAYVPLFDSMPRRISEVIIARGGCSEY
ncbi:hypothetical protein TNCV_1562211 [Trichonephila clavipes]|nr:hypothetical protein TNCV_1562211 [Trichonephila clavipes]